MLNWGGGLRCSIGEGAEGGRGAEVLNWGGGGGSIGGGAEVLNWGGGGGLRCSIGEGG